MHHIEFPLLNLLGQLTSWMLQWSVSPPYLQSNQQFFALIQHATFEFEVKSNLNVHIRPRTALIKEPSLSALTSYMEVSDPQKNRETTSVYQDFMGVRGVLTTIKCSAGLRRTGIPYHVLRPCFHL